LISFTLIFLVHHLYIFLLNTLTVPKIKDLVNKPNQQYQDIFKTMQSDTKNDSTKNDSNDPMADELTSFLSDLKKTTQKKVETIGDINSFPTANEMSFSVY